MYIIFLAILPIFSLVPMVDALIEKKKPKEKNAVITKKMRYKGHLQSIAYLWGGVLVVFIMCVIGNVSPHTIGLRLFDFQYNIWITVITLVLCGLPT